MSGDSTVSFWVRVLAAPATDYWLHKYSGVLGWAVYTGSASLRFFQNAADRVSFSHGLTADGFFHHICVVRIGTVTTMYVDGVLMGTSLAYSAGTPSSLDMQLGGSAVSQAFNSFVDQDDVAFWSRGLSPAEVAAIFAEGIIAIPASGTPGGGLRGAQFDHQATGSFRVVEQYQPGQAPLATTTVLPFTLDHRPTKREAVAVYAGEAPLGAAQLQRLGVDYDVNIETRKVTWLATARKPLGTTAVIIVRYWRRRVLDQRLVALGLE